MAPILLQTLPFFAIIGLGYGAGRCGIFGPEATAALTRFVFYFALSALLLGFSATLSFGDLLDGPFLAAYLTGTLAVYLLVTGVALLRGLDPAEAAVEAQCGAIGNVGFLGLPLLAILLGEEAIRYNMMVLSVDLIVFGSLIVILVTGSREARSGVALLGTVLKGLATNPMIVSIIAGLAWSATGWPLPGPASAVLGTLGAAATPCALFAIGASLAERSAERLAVAGWLSAAKLALHPAAVALTSLWLFPVDRYAAAVMIAAASLPVAGNIYILAAQYRVAPQRVSAAILLSTAASVLTVTFVIARTAPLLP